MRKKMVIWAMVMGVVVATSGLAMAGAGGASEGKAATPAKAEAVKPAEPAKTEATAPAKPAEAAAPAPQATPAKPAKKKIEGC
ncbi:MAG TPA: hypothetical protein VLL73_08270 [Desulfurivibrionaceae bacterium]|nr:hypothetical protein [Desulfurivibrionaceae bacterium]